MPESQQEISALQNRQREDGPSERLADRSGFYVGPDRHYGRRGEHSHQKLRKIHGCPPLTIARRSICEAAGPPICPPIAG